MSTGIIYCAHCLVTGKKYIGQTIRSLKIRIKNHKSDSKKLNFLFYKAINKHGWNNFVWGIIEECKVEDLIDREKYWIDYYNTYYEGYNSTLGGEGSSNPSKFRSFRLKCPIGEIVEGKNVSKFCRENGLVPSNIYAVINGKYKSSNGWTLPETEICKETFRIRNSKEFTLLSPNGEIIKSKNIKKFCKQNNLRYAGIIDVISGFVKSYNGWSLIESKKYSPNPNRGTKRKKYSLKSPDGKIYSGENILEFARKNNLDSRHLCKVLSGKRKSHKGWTLP